MPDLQERVEALIDDALFKAYWEAVDHHGTTDLVVCFDDSLEEDPVFIYRRESLAHAGDLPLSLRKKLSTPASDAVFIMSGSETAFWFVAMFSNGDMGCVAVNAKRIAPGGNA